MVCLAVTFAQFGGSGSSRLYINVQSRINWAIVNLKVVVEKFNNKLTIKQFYLEIMNIGYFIKCYEFPNIYGLKLYSYIKSSVYIAVLRK